jgi:hypothetical protein
VFLLTTTLPHLNSGQYPWLALHPIAELRKDETVAVLSLKMVNGKDQKPMALVGLA